MSAPPPTPAPSPWVHRTGWLCAAFAALMIGVAFASAPLYNLFCRLTGFDGTPRVGAAAPQAVLARTVAVRFDANVAPGLAWRFAPEVAEIEAKLGETQTVFFKVRNDGRTASTGIATFNVQPGQAGAFFVKIQCFCYDEQTLQPGETLDFPVAFYIDPSLAGDRNMQDLPAITLSYTYFASKNGQPVAARAATALKPNL